MSIALDIEPRQPRHAIHPAFEDTLDQRAARAAHAVEGLARYEDYGIRRTFHGFYYISHYYPLRAMRDVDLKTIETRLRDLEEQTFETYIHFPYCEYLCTFCHFYKKPSGSVTTLLDKEDVALNRVEREMRMYRDLFGGPIQAHSLQLGGGTPSMISNKRLVALLETVRECMVLDDDAEIKIEIYPQDYEEGDLREKLQILKDFGFTDLVVDLESGNKETLDYINRPRSSLETYLRVLDVAVSAGHTSFITALMAGLPRETFESLDRTIQTLKSIEEVKVVNVFPVIMRETDPITTQLRRNPADFHDAATRDQMWIFARNELRDSGWTEGPISYLHRSDVRPEQQSDKFECVNLLGFGTSGFGYLNGNGWASQYFNFCNDVDYAKRVDAGEPPIWRMGIYDQAERARRKVIFGLANVKSAENLVAIEQRFGVDVDEIYGRTFNALLMLGLIEVVPIEHGIRFTEDGLARLEEICYLLQSDYAKDACDTQPDADDPRSKELINQHYAVTMPSEDRAAFEALVADQPREFMHRIR